MHPAGVDKAAVPCNIQAQVGKQIWRGGEGWGGVGFRVNLEGGGGDERRGRWRSTPTAILIKHTDNESSRL